MKTHYLAYPDILTIIQTHEEATLLTEQLSRLIDALYSAKQGVTDVIGQFVSYDKKGKLLALMVKAGVVMEDATEVQKFFVDMQASIKQISVVHLVLAFEPKEDFISALSSWFIIHTKQALLLDITTDITIGGGIIIEYKGVHKDYSLKKILADKWQKGEIHLDI